MEKVSLIAGSFFGVTGIIIGAVGSHALSGYLTPETIVSFQIGNKYQIYHALFLLILGVLYNRYTGTLIKISILNTIIGISLFSGSLYLLSLAKIKVGIITPIGGMLLISAWILFLIQVLIKKGPTNINTS